jgi:Helix-turn-helix domain
MGRLYRKGWSFNAIGHELDRRGELVKDCLASSGVRLRKDAKRVRHRPDVLPATLRRLYDQGATPGQLADKFSVSLGTVYTRLREAGTVMRPRGRPHGWTPPLPPPPKPPPPGHGYTLAEIRENLITKSGVAARTGTSIATVHHWATAYDDWPDPLIPGHQHTGYRETGGIGAVYWWPQIGQFLGRHGFPRGRGGSRPRSAPRPVPADA